MEKITLEKDITKNISLGNNSYKIFSEGLEYTLKISKNEKYELNLIITKEDSMENFEQNLTLEEINTTQCFKMEEDIDEIISVMMQYILEDKISLALNDEGISVIFESQFNFKKLKSIFQLKIQEENMENAVKFLKIKINYLINENKEKDKIIKEIEKQNIENLKKIDFFNNEVEKMKEMQEKQANLINELKNNSAGAAPTFNTGNAIKPVVPKKQSLCPASVNYPAIKDHTSEILSPDGSDRVLLLDWVGQFFYLELLYSSNLHGKKCEDFHKRCDGRSITLTLYKAKNGKRFGGFSYLTFSSTNQFLKGNGEDFIFSLDKRKMFKNNKDLIYSLYNNPNFFPTFGYPSDLYIHKDCFTSPTSYSSFPSSYGNGTTEIGANNNYFAGEKNFILDLIEVYQVVFDEEI